MDIATRLDEAMQARGVESQSALARASGVPQPTINRILKGVGTKGPEAGTVRRLADALDVPFEWLNDGIGEMSRRKAATSFQAEGWSELTRVDAYELRILNLVRQLDERGRDEAESDLQELIKGVKAMQSPQDDSAEQDRRKRTLDKKTHQIGLVPSVARQRRKS